MHSFRRASRARGRLALAPVACAVVRYLAVDPWGAVSALAAIALVLAASVAAWYAKRTIDIQRTAIEAASQEANAAEDRAREHTAALLKTSAESLAAARSDAQAAQAQAQAHTEALLKTSAASVAAAREDAQRAQDVARRDTD